MPTGGSAKQGGVKQTRLSRVHATSVVLLALAAACAPVAPGLTPRPSVPDAASPTTSSRASRPDQAPTGLGPVPGAPLSAAISARLHALLDDVVVDKRSPGIAAAIVTIDGTWSGAAGVGDPATGTALSRDAEFDIGSVSKTLLAALVLNEVEAATMDLDAPLARYLPDDFDAISNGATVRQALGHRSGIAEHVEEAFIEQILSDCSRAWTAAEVAALIPSPSVGSGSRFEYSNSNYILLGIALEQTSNRELGWLVRALLAPLDLPRVVFQPDEIPLEPLALPHLDLDQDGAWDHLDTGGLLPCRAMATAAGAAGGVAADAPSLAKWGWLLYGGGVLNPSSLAAMTAIGPEGYGLGTARYQVADTIGFGHAGSIPGYGSLLIVIPRDRLALAVLVNGDRGDILPEVAERIVGVVRRSAGN
jgi:D-alanyl-D-alanine carboxypeptidase